MKSTKPLSAVCRRSLAIGVAVSFFILHPSSFLHAQMVVPKGWENVDSIRFEVENSFFDSWEDGAPPGESPERTKRIMDSLNINMLFTYGIISANRPPYGAKRKGFDAYPVLELGTIDLQAVGEKLKQRVFYPSPVASVYDGETNYRWRYIDTIHYTWHNNLIDSNYISRMQNSIKIRILSRILLLRKCTIRTPILCKSARREELF